MKTVDLLGVLFEGKTIPEYKKDLAEFLRTSTTSLVVTPNPEMLVAGVFNSRLRKILNQASLRLVDGVGVVVMSGWRLRRWPGVDALAFLAWETNRRGMKMLLAGGSHEGDAQKAASALRRIRAERTLCDAEGVIGFSPGRLELTKTGWVGDEALKETIEREKPDVLALALGHGKQELWLLGHLQEFSFFWLRI